MSNWWDDAPLADAKATAAQDWWANAPLASDPSGPQGRGTMPAEQDPRRLDVRAARIAQMDDEAPSAAFANPAELLPAQRTSPSGSVLDSQTSAIGGNFDPMLRPEFVQGFRAELAQLPIENRLAALRAYAATGDAYGRAAKVILSNETVKNADYFGKDQDRQLARTLNAAPAAPRLSSGLGQPPSEAFPEATVQPLDAPGTTARDVATTNATAQALNGAIDTRATRSAFTDAGRRRLASQMRNPSQWADDAMTDLAEGTVNLVKLPVDLAAPDSAFAAHLRDAQKAIRERSTPEMQARQAELSSRVLNEQGFLNQFGTTVMELMTSPTVALSESLKQLPMFAGVMVGAGAGGALGTAAVAAGTRASPILALGEAISGGALAAKAGQAGAMVGGAATSVGMTAGDAAGNTYDQLTDPARTPMQVWQKNPDFIELVGSDPMNPKMDPRRAIEQIAATKARLAALVAAPLGILGFMGAEASMVSKSAARMTLGKAGALGGKEIGGEIIEEGGTQMASNAAIRTADPTQDLMQGVGQAAGTAAVVSAPMAGMAIARGMTAPSPGSYFANLNPNLTAAAPIAPRVEDMPTVPTVPNISRASRTVPAASGAADRVADILGVNADAPAPIQSPAAGPAVDGLPAGPAADGGRGNTDAGTSVPAGDRPGSGGNTVDAGQSGSAPAGDPAPLAAQSAAVAPDLNAKLNPSGTLTISGEPQAIRQMLTDNGITSVLPTQGGLLVGKSQAAKAQQLVEDFAPAQAATPAPIAPEAKQPATKGDVTETADSAVQNIIGRDSVPIDEGGKPFKTRAAAAAAKKLQPVLRVVTVDGGYALAPKTDKQLAAGGVFRHHVHFGRHRVAGPGPHVVPGEQAAQPAVAGIEVEALVPELRDLEGGDGHRRRHDLHGHRVRAGQRQHAGQRGDHVALGDHAGERQEVRGPQADAPAQAVRGHGGGDRLFLDRMAAAARVVDGVAQGRELAQAHPAPGQRMVLAHHADVFLAKQRLAVEGPAEILEVADRQVDLAAAHAGFALAQRAHVDRLQADAGGFPLYGLHHLGQHDHLADVGHVDAEHPVGMRRVEILLLRQRAADAFDRVLQRQADLQRARRRHHALGGAHEERVAERGPQAVQCVADGRLRQAQMRCRAGRAPAGQDSLEHEQQVEVETRSAHPRIVDLPPGAAHREEPAGGFMVCESREAPSSPSRAYRPPDGLFCGRLAGTGVYGTNSGVDPGISAFARAFIPSGLTSGQAPVFSRLSNASTAAADSAASKVQCPVRSTTVVR